MTGVLLERIEEKKNKPNYPDLKRRLGLAKLVLLVHYGLRGLIHNAPLEGMNWKIENIVSEARAHLTRHARPFDRVFLYLAYNDGQLFTIYP